MIRLIRFFRGFVLCQVTGGYFAKLINLLISAGITVVRSRALKLGGELVVPAGEYKKIRPLAKKAQCRVRVKKRYGLIFRLKKNRYFVTKAASALVFAAVLIFLSTRIVGIDYVGKTSSSRREIDAALSQSGVCIGAPKQRVNGHRAAIGLLAEFDNLGWAAVNKHPFYVSVEMSEKTDVPAPSYPTGRVMIAKYDAVITELTLSEGLPSVTVGQTIEAGQTLAYGDAMPGYSARVGGVSGVCKGIIRVEIDIAIPDTVVTRLFSGKSETTAEISIFGVRAFSLPFGRCRFVEYDVATQCFTPRLFGVYLPVSVERRVFIQAHSVSVPVNDTNAIHFCERLALEKLGQEYGHFRIHDADYVVEGSVGHAVFLLETEISEMISP